MSYHTNMNDKNPQAGEGRDGMRKLNLDLINITSAKAGSFINSAYTSSIMAGSASIASSSCSICSHPPNKQSI